MIQESAVARDRERSVRSIIELSSQADLMKMMNEMMKDVMKDQIFSQTRREEVSTQRNSSQFEMIENVVSSRKQVFVRDRVVTRERKRRRKRRKRRRKRRKRRRKRRKRRRERDRERNRDREREDKDDTNASIKDVNEVIQ